MSKADAAAEIALDVSAPAIESAGEGASQGLPPPTGGVLALIERVALDPAANVETLERLYAMHERDLARRAGQAFAADYVRMKPHLPLVIKTHLNDQTHSRYAKLEDINQQIDPILESFGFATATKVVAQTDALITVRCELWHQQGHVESTELSMPLDDSGIAGKVNKTKPHAIASTVTYLKRVGLCALLNISTGDDKDGNAPDTKLDADQIDYILSKIPEAKAGPKFLKYVQAESVEKAGSLEAAVATIPQRNYRMAVTALEDMIAKREAADANTVP
jgi:hypothetical protein